MAPGIRFGSASRSLLARFWQTLRRPTSFVGKDLEGNRFYEYPPTSNDPRRTKRIVKYRKQNDMMEYATGVRHLAVQWKTWLTHTRPDPPALDELRADLARQQRVRQNVAILEVRDQKERWRITEASMQQATNQSPRPFKHDAPDNGGLAEQVQHDHQRSALALDSRPPIHVAVEREQPLPQSRAQTKPSDEPQPWTPKAARRGG